jgi:hypothetical protein
MRSRPRSELRALAIAAALALSAAAPARAFPVFFNGDGGFGVSATSANAAQSVGFRVIGGPLYPADSYDLSIPAPEVLSFHIRTSPSLSHPTTAESRWTVTNGGETALDDAWLVFFTPVTYTDSKVGIDLQMGGQWALVEASAGEVDYFYPAVFLGDLDSSDSVSFFMHHVIAQSLTKQGSTYILPKYSVGLLQGVPLPEGSVLVSLAAGLALVAALRRGKV